MPAPKGHPPYNINGEGGRPKVHTKEMIEQYADELEAWLFEDEKNYWFNKWCHSKKIHPENMSIWAKESERFDQVYRLAKSIQEERIFCGSLENNYNSKMATMNLTNWHGWKDKQEQTLVGDAEHPLSFAMPSIDNSTKDLVDE